MIKESGLKDIPTEQLNEIFSAVGWKKRSDKKWKEVLQKSSFIYSLWDNKTLIGLGRILEDGVMCMFYDIAVLPTYQNKGLGSKIMNALIEEVKDKKYASIGLFAWNGNPQNVPFYKKFGFEQVTGGMELVKYMQRE